MSMGNDKKNKKTVQKNIRLEEPLAHKFAQHAEKARLKEGDFLELLVYLFEQECADDTEKFFEIYKQCFFTGTIPKRMVINP